MRTVPTRSERLVKEKENATAVINNESEVNTIKNELAFVVLNNESFNVEGLATGYGAATGTISDLLGRIVPKGKRDQLKRAYKYYEEDDLLNKLVNIKIDFVTAGINVTAQPRKTDAVTPEQVEEFQETIDQVELDIDLDKLSEDLARDWIVSDNMILYWRTDPSSSAGLSSESSIPTDEFETVGIPGVYDICTLDPCEVDWDNSLGQDILQLRIPNAVIDKVNNAFAIRGSSKVLKLTKEEIYQDLMDEGIGKKWIDAVRNRKDFVTLKKEDGDNWLIQTKERKHSGLAKPSMKTIFLRLEQRRILSEGDFSASIMMKHFIQLIKQGESITQGPLAGQRTNWMTPAEATELLKKFSTVNKALRVAVNHTTIVEFIFPPKEIFNLDKFEKCELCIYVWSGITVTIVIGEGGKYSSGFISIKRMVADIGKIRKKISSLFINFFRHPTIAPKLSTPPRTLVAVNYDSDVLKDPRQLLEEVKFMFENSIMDHRTAATSLDRDPETLKASAEQTKREHAKGAWTPTGTQGQVGGFGFGNEGGRPPNDDTTVDEVTRMQRPTARQTENT